MLPSFSKLLKSSLFYLLITNAKRAVHLKRNLFYLYEGPESSPAFQSPSKAICPTYMKGQESAPPQKECVLPIDQPESSPALQNHSNAICSTCIEGQESSASNGICSTYMRGQRAPPASQTPLKAMPRELSTSKGICSNFVRGFKASSPTAQTSSKGVCRLF